MASSPTRRCSNWKKTKAWSLSAALHAENPEFMGTVEQRTPHFWRKVRYSYMDARRYANAQGLTIKGPRRIYDAFYASAGMLFAQRHGFFAAIMKRFSDASGTTNSNSTSCRKSAA